MSAHTPGPWEVVDLPHGIVVRTESPKKSQFGASRYAAIGGFDRGDAEQLSEALANARLIAAAPCMLQALRRAVLALAFAAETSPAMRDDYEFVSKAIEKAVQP